MGSLQCPEDYPASVLEAESSIVFCLDQELNLTYCNPAWDRFAVENGGTELCLPSPIGHSILDYITGPDREYFGALYRHLLGRSDVWERDYECSSKTLLRRFRQRIVPLSTTRGLIVMNSLRVERPHDLQSSPPVDEVYRDANGMIRMCSSCRRTRRNVPVEDIWDWVPDFVDTFHPAITHGICPPCRELYYPGWF